MRAAVSFRHWHSNLVKDLTRYTVGEIWADDIVGESYRFDATLVENVLANLKHGKAAGLDGITAEHLRYSHALLSVVLLLLLENWFNVGVTRVKWGCHYSCFLELLCGIRQLFSRRIYLRYKLYKKNVWHNHTNIWKLKRLLNKRPYISQYHTIVSRDRYQY